MAAIERQHPSNVLKIEKNNKLLVYFKLFFLRLKGASEK